MWKPPELDRQSAQRHAAAPLSADPQAAGQAERSTEPALKEVQLPSAERSAAAGKILRGLALEVAPKPGTEQSQEKTPAPTTTAKEETTKTSFTKTTLNVIKYLWEKHREAAAKQTALMLPAAVAGPVTTALTAMLVDSLVKGGQTSAAVGTALIGAGFIAYQFLLGFIQNQRNKVEQTFQASLQVDGLVSVPNWMRKLSIAQLLDPDKQKELQGVRFNDRLGTFTQSLFLIGSNAVQTAAAFLAMAVVDWRFACGIMATALPLIWLERRKAAWKSTADDEMVKIGKRAWPFRWGMTDLQNFIQYRVLGKDQWAVDRLKQQSSEIVKIQHDFTRKTSKADLLYTALGTGTTALVLGYVIHAATKGAITQGQVLQFLGSAGFLAMAMSGFSQLLGRMEQDTKFLGSVMNGQSAGLEQKKAIKPELAAFLAKLERQAPTILLDRVRYEVPASVKEPDSKTSEASKTPPFVLEIDHLELPPGKLIGVIGPSGCGKSTLIKLIVGLIEPQSGSVQLKLGAESHDLREIPLEAWHKCLGYLPQEYLSGFTMTPWESVVELGKRDPAEGQSLKAAAEKTGAWSILPDEREWKKDYIGDATFGGRSFSGGEVQRFANTRAIIGERNITILDEPCKQLDEANEMLFVRNLRAEQQRSPNRTWLIVSHNDRTLLDVDSLLELRDGKVRAFKPNHEFEQDPDSMYTRGLTGLLKMVSERHPELVRTTLEETAKKDPRKP